VSVLASRGMPKIGEAAPRATHARRMMLTGFTVFVCLLVLKLHTELCRWVKKHPVGAVNGDDNI
jgi:hypothetical protein